MLVACRIHLGVILFFTLGRVVIRGLLIIGVGLEFVAEVGVMVFVAIVRLCAIA